MIQWQQVAAIVGFKDPGGATRPDTRGLRVDQTGPTRGIWRAADVERVKVGVEKGLTECDIKLTNRANFNFYDRLVLNGTLRFDRLLNDKMRTQIFV